MMNHLVISCHLWSCRFQIPHYNMVENPSIPTSSSAWARSFFSSSIPSVVLQCLPILHYYTNYNMVETTSIPTSSSAWARSFFSSSIRPRSFCTSTSYCSIRRLAWSSSILFSWRIFFSLLCECFRSVNSWRKRSYKVRIQASSMVIIWRILQLTVRMLQVCQLLKETDHTNVRIQCPQMVVSKVKALLDPQ